MHPRGLSSRIALTLLTTLLSGCAMTGGGTPTETPSPLPPSATPTKTAKPTATITSTPFYAVEPARTGIKVGAGGFEFTPIKGYDVEDDNGGAYLESKDGEVVVVFEAFAQIGRASCRERV